MSCRSIRVAVSEKLINDINFLLCLTFSTSISVKPYDGQVFAETAFHILLINSIPYSNPCSDIVSVSFSTPKVSFWLQKSISSSTSNVLLTLPTSTQHRMAVHVFFIWQAVVPLIFGNARLAGHSTEEMLETELIRKYYIVHVVQI